jgi:transcription-repair coupling factor (superfamily II helicase)
MSLYRRINEFDDAERIEAFGAELIDRFGPLPDATENLLTLMAIKLHARNAHIAKIDVGAKGALVSFWNDSFPNLPGLLAYVDRLKGTAKLRPDNKLSISRDWDTPRARLNGALQLARGLAKIAK